MTALRQRNDPLRLMGRRLLLAALAILAVAMLWGVWNIWQKEREAAQLQVQAQTQLAQLQARQQVLEAQYQSLDSERGMEAAVRQQYGMGDQGEGMVVIVEPPNQPPPAATSSSMMDWFKDALSRF